MRFLHTSDWHLGRSFHKVDLLAAQAAFLDSLVETVASERVDTVLVSGDVYDRALPSVDAVSLCSDVLARLSSAGARVIVISGNHDSARRLGFGSRLIDAAGVHLRTDPRCVGEPVLLSDEHGPLAVYGLPYLEPEAVRGELGPAEGPRGHAHVLGDAMDRVRDDLSRRAGARSVVLAHAFVTGGAPSDSERDIAVGGVARVPVDVFGGVDYVALGHLHGRQTLASGVRYSGSPLAYSFSEAAHRKGSWLVDLDGSGVAAVHPVDAPVPRSLSLLRGRLDELLGDRRWAGVEAHWLSVTLTDPVRQVEPMARLRTRFPHVVCLDWQPEGGAGDDGLSYAARLAGRDDLEVAHAFVEHVRRSPATVVEDTLLCEAFAAARELSC